MGCLVDSFVRAAGDALGFREKEEKRLVCRMVNCFVAGCGGVEWFVKKKGGRNGRGGAVCSMAEDVGQSVRAVIAGAAVGFLLSCGPAQVGLADVQHDLVEEAAGIIDRMSLYKSSIDLEAFTESTKAQNLPTNKDAYRTIEKLVKSLGDKYARFLAPEDFNRLAKYDITGLGLLLSTDVKERFVVSTTPSADSPAGMEGVQRGDFVEAIAGKSTKGMTALEALDLLQGENGSKVEVLLKTVGQEPRVVELTRKMTTPNPVSYSLKMVKGKRVGYIRLREFNASCNLKVRDAITDLKSRGVDAFVLDLRSNRGGVVEGALDIAGLFMEKGTPVMKMVDRSGTVKSVDAKEIGKQDLVQEPLIIVTNKYSASASEVLTGGLRANCRAVSIGQTTFGKGVIQGVFGLSDGSAVVITTAKYQTPSGEEINGVGIKPDFVVMQPGENYDARLRPIDFDKVDLALKACVPPK